MPSLAPKHGNWHTELDDFLQKEPRKPLVVIVGPTASGKTALSIAIAKAVEVTGKAAEIVNADSRQFYKGFDIGTAKITQKEMSGVPHHLLSILDPAQDCSIAWFKTEATKCIDEIHARGHLPILVGGSMLYVSALIDGFEPIASADPKLRARLEAEYDADAGLTLSKKLQEIDPETAASFPMQNKVYVVRALEIYESTGQTKSSLKRKSQSPYDLLMFGIEVEREELKKRIEERTRQMLTSGWVEEVKKLKEQGTAASAPAMQSIGYREIYEWLSSNPQPRPAYRTGRFDNRGAEIIESPLREVISSKTSAYAKRAMTWWRRDARIHWLRSDALGSN